MQLIKNQIIESIYLCKVWNQNFESVNVDDEGGKFNKSCYNIEETVEKNLIRLMRYARKDVFPNYTLVNQRVNSFTGWIAVKKESELS
jgi:ABC-type transporter lipoprotein component MlaA